MYLYPVFHNSKLAVKVSTEGHVKHVIVDWYNKASASHVSHVTISVKCWISICLICCSVPLLQCRRKNMFWWAMQTSLSTGSLDTDQFASLIKSLIDSIGELLSIISSFRIIHNFHSWASFASCFQRPQSSDISRAHVSYHVRLHVLVHMSVLQCRKSVFVCVLLCMQKSVSPGLQGCVERAWVTCEHTFWSQRSWDKDVNSEIILKAYVIDGWVGTVELMLWTHCLG